MNFTKVINQILLLPACLIMVISFHAQSNSIGQETSVINNINTITTAVPFLLISPDSRSGAMGDVGVAIKPDANSTHWNPAKLAFIDDSKHLGFSMSYSPWLRALVNDINLAYLTGYFKLDRNSAVGVSMRYFSLGNITFTDEFGAVVRDFKPNEFAFDACYSRKLGSNLSAGLSARYIYSNLTGNINVPGSGGTQAGQSVATDLSLYYITNEFKLAEKKADVAIGMNISNIGAKIRYVEGAQRDFIPTNLRLGTAFNMEIDEFNEFTIALDANKLLVPTQPVYERDADGKIVAGTNGPVIFSGRDPNVGVASGIFGSFSDAPGNVVYDGNSREVSGYASSQGDAVYSSFVSRAIFVENQNSPAKVHATVGYWTGSAFSFASPVEVVSSAYYGRVALDTSTGKVLVVYVRSNYVRCKVGTPSSSGITFGSEVTINSDNFGRSS